MSCQHALPYVSNTNTPMLGASIPYKHLHCSVVGSSTGPAGPHAAASRTPVLGLLTASAATQLRSLCADICKHIPATEGEGCLQYWLVTPEVAGSNPVVLVNKHSKDYWGFTIN